MTARKHQLELFHGRHRDQRVPRLPAGAVCSRCDRAARELVRLAGEWVPRCSWHTGERLPTDLIRNARRRLP